MKFFEMLSKVDSKDVYIIELQEVGATAVTKEGKEFIKSTYSTNEFVATTKNADNNFKSLVDDKLYDDYWNVYNSTSFSEAYEKETGKKCKDKISKREAVNLAKKLTLKRKKQVEQELSSGV